MLKKKTRSTEHTLCSSDLADSHPTEGEEFGIVSLFYINCTDKFYLQETVGTAWMFRTVEENETFQKFVTPILELRRFIYQTFTELSDGTRNISFKKLEINYCNCERLSTWFRFV